MTVPSELEKLNAVAQAEASEGSLNALRRSSVFSAVTIGMACVQGGTQLQNSVVRVLTVLVVAVTVSIYVGWRYAPAIEKAFEPFVFGMLVIFGIHFGSGMHFGSWVEWVCLAAVAVGFVFGAFDALRTARAVWLANLPECVVEHETIRGWSSRLTSESTWPDIVQFAADESWTDGTVVVRLLQKDNWIVLASLLKADPTKILTLSIFDGRTTTISYSQGQRRFRIGDRKFRRVEFTPELTVLANRLAQEGS
jgi:type III secretory pathway component EscS